MRRWQNPTSFCVNENRVPDGSGFWWWIKAIYIQISCKSNIYRLYRWCTDFCQIVQIPSTVFVRFVVFFNSLMVWKNNLRFVGRWWLSPLHLDTLGRTSEWWMMCPSGNDPKTQLVTKTSWWFFHQHIRKICARQIGSSSQVRVKIWKKKTSWKPPPRWALNTNHLKKYWLVVHEPEAFSWGQIFQHIVLSNLQRSDWLSCFLPLNLGYPQLGIGLNPVQSFYTTIYY